MWRSDLRSAQYSSVVRLFSPCSPPDTGRTLSVLTTSSASLGRRLDSPWGWNLASMYASSHILLSESSSGGEKWTYPKPADTPQLISRELLV